jgi:hypothetical protein
MRNKESGATTTFEQDQDGLFSAPLGPEPSEKVEVSMFTTVEENKKFYNKRQVERAEKARNLYRVIGCPSIRDYKHIIQTNQIKNCPVTLEDIRVSERNNILP